MRLTREVRCRAGGRNDGVTSPNNWAGPAGDHAADAFWILRATVEGDVDPTTGYVCDIRVIDDWLRGVIAPALRDRLGRSLAGSAAGCLCDAIRAVVHTVPALIKIDTIEWALSPFTRYAIVNNGKNTVLLTRGYEFSAAHRLFCSDYSEEQNRHVFGKCSNPHGHGHNYVVEVTVEGTPSETTGLLVPVSELDRIVHERVVEPFDHKNLNAECADFASLNPSVENIARVIFSRLDRVFDGVRLAKIHVWETPKTSAICTAADVMKAT